MSEAEQRLVYRGHPAIVSALAQELREHGVESDYDAPTERRSLEGLGDAVVVGLVVRGTSAAVEAALRSFRERWKGRADVTVEVHPPDETEPQPRDPEAGE